MDVGQVMFNDAGLVSMKASMPARPSSRTKLPSLTPLNGHWLVAGKWLAGGAVELPIRSVSSIQFSVSMGEWYPGAVAG